MLLCFVTLSLIVTCYFICAHHDSWKRLIQISQFLSPLVALYVCVKKKLNEILDDRYIQNIYTELNLDNYS